MIKPTVGRIVWYWSSASTSGQPEAAVISYVHSNVLINIAAFTKEGASYFIEEVDLYQGTGERPPNGYAEWMPYQIGQAKANPPIAN